MLTSQRQTTSNLKHQTSNTKPTRETTYPNSGSFSLLIYLNHQFYYTVSRVSKPFEFFFQLIKQYTMSNIFCRINLFSFDAANYVFKILSRRIPAAQKSCFSFMKFRVIKTNLASLQTDQHKSSAMCDILEGIVNSLQIYGTWRKICADRFAERRDLF